jgi:hypothetical protein
MEHIRIKNLRCLADTGKIAIKPITVLVGANSSGKSSFLRLFPLLRQSAETRTLSGLLLNEGDVNFGFFPDAIHRDADPAELKLEFTVSLRPGFYQGGMTNRFLVGSTPIECEVSYAKRSKDQRYPFLRSVNLRMQTEKHLDCIDIQADEEGRITKFLVNDFSATSLVSQLRLHVGRGLVPTLITGIDSKSGTLSALETEISEVESFEQKLLQQTDSSFHGKTSIDTRLAIFKSIRIGSPSQMLTEVKTPTGVGVWDMRVSQWTLESSHFKDLRNSLLGRAASEILAATNSYVTQLAASVYYFQPVRAGVQRDYLSRDVQVGSVDSSGLNVAMVLASLGTQALNKFREWMQQHFGFEVYPQSVGDGARIALRMRETSTNVEFNLADMGFGFSQMLPFLVQIWNIIEHEPLKSRTRWYSQRFPAADLAVPQSYIIAIEQPELHLHPALQARLADLFVAMARLSREREIPVRFILETHSPAIIERIGALVELEQLDPHDVQILLFERGREGSSANTSMVRTTEFDSAGILKDWPFGFLSPHPPNPLFEKSGAALSVEL